MEAEHVERRQRVDRRKGGVLSLVGAVGSILVGFAMLAVATRLAPHAAGLSAALIALVWGSLLIRKPHVRRSELVLTGAGASLLLWTVVFFLPPVIRFFSRPAPERDLEGNLLEPVTDLRPPAPSDGYEWFDNSAVMGLLAAAGICLMGYGWRTIRRRRGRRGARRVTPRRGAAGEALETTGEHTPAEGEAYDESTPTTPVMPVPRVSGGRHRQR